MSGQQWRDFICERINSQWCSLVSSFFRQSCSEQREILMLVADPNSLEVCSSSALSMTFPFGCWSITSTTQSWLPRDCYKEFVKDHKSLAAKKSHPASPRLNSLLDTLWHQRKMFEALQTDRGQTPLPMEWHSSDPMQVVWFSLQAAGSCSLLPRLGIAVSRCTVWC